MQIEFLDEDQFDAAFDSGRFSKKLRGEDTSPEWIEQEEAITGKLFDEVDAHYSREEVYVNGDIWADETLRLDIPSATLTPQFLQFLLLFLHKNAPEHCFLVSISSTFEPYSEGVGRILLNLHEIGIEDDAKDLWLENIGNYAQSL